MSFNIVDLVQDQIGDQVLGQLSGFLGASPESTKGALAGALPGLLGGITNAASHPRGATDLFNSVQSQDDGLLENMGNLLGGNQAKDIGSAGTSLLTSLLGDGALGQLAGVIASVAGVGRGNSSSLLGMLAPIIIGVIKKKVFDGGLNAGSLASMLTQQQDNINAAMPQAFSNQLQSAGFFDSIAPESLAALSDPKPASPVAAAPAREAEPTQQKSGGGMMKWLIALVAVVGIGWFGMQYMNEQAATKAAAEAEAAAAAAAEKAAAVKLQAEEARQKAADAAAEALTAAQDAMPAGVDLGKISNSLEGVFGSATDALSGITDLESAKSAIPALEGATSQLSGLNDLITRLPDAARGPLGAIVANGLGTIQPLIDKVTAIPGVGALVEPVVAPLMEMLNGLAG